VRSLVMGLCMLAATMTGSVFASEAEVRKNLQARYPGIPIESVTRSPLPGIFEVYANGAIIYTDEKVNYVFIDGRLVDAKSRTDLTGLRMRKLQAIPFESLPLNQSFKMVNGNGKRKVAYFADPNCGYCKKFDQELVNVKDVTIHVFLLPILSQDSYEKARAIWCSKDRAKAWNDWMLKGVAPAATANCATPLDANVQFGQQKGISGTPTLILSDGSRVPGMVPAAEFSKLLDAAGK